MNGGFHRLILDSLLNVYSIALVLSIAVFSVGRVLIWDSLAQFNRWTYADRENIFSVVKYFHLAAKQVSEIILFWVWMGGQFHLDCQKAPLGIFHTKNLGHIIGEWRFIQF